MFVSKETDVSRTNSFSGRISIFDAVAIVAGMVIGPGIFKTPSIVAASSSDEIVTLSLWAAGGLISLIGALCYAELTSTYPHAGGEYHYLVRAFGKKIAFLFAWARMTVIQTGSIAMLSFVVGDYAMRALNLGPNSSSIYAALTVFILTAINLKGINPSSKVQKVLMIGMLLGLLFVVIVGLTVSSEPLQAEKANTTMAFGQAMIFVLLTYGGWNEAAYLSADVSRNRSDIVKVLFYSLALITFVYLLTNFSLIKGLGFSSLVTSNEVAADLVRKVLGEEWKIFISALIAIAALSTVNAVMITGARTNYALGNDFDRFGFLSRWTSTDNSPVHAFIFQSGIALILIALGSVTRSGFVTMVEYTAPVFWFFFLMVGISLIVLRRKDPQRQRPFTVPFYPLTPVLFCLSALFMLYSSTVYTGIGAMVGITVLLAGIPFIIFKDVNKKGDGTI